MKKYIKGQVSKFIYTEDLTNLWSDHKKIDTVIDVNNLAFKDSALEAAFNAYQLPRSCRRNSQLMLVAILFSIVPLTGDLNTV